MAGIPLDVPVRDWHCPTCDYRDRTQEAAVHTRFHNCPAMGGLGLPMVEVRGVDGRADARAVVNLVEDGPDLASVSTEHGSGRVDCTVFPETAHMILRSH
jgi:hypothetical protein